MNDQLTITCPSGLTGRVRGLKIKDLNTFAAATDANASKITEMFDKILADCWVETLDPGPGGPAFYDERSCKISWTKALLTDRFFALISIRMATTSLGTLYTFKHKCLDCGHMQNVEVDLQTLDLAMMDEDAVRKFAEGNNRFEAQLSDGSQIDLKLFTGKDERQVSKIARKNKDARVSVGLTYRVVAITDVDNGTEHTDQTTIRNTLDNLDESELEVITDAIDKLEGGLDNMIEFECEECGSDREARIPFGGAFWISAKTKKRSRGSTAFSGG